METVTLLYEDYQKELAEDFKNTFLKRASDTDSSRSNDAVIDEVTDMLSTNIAVYTEKLLRQWGFSSGGEGGSGGGDVTVTLDDLLQKYLEDNYVTIKGDQEVYGEKDFRKGIRIAGRRLYWDESNDALVIEGAAYTTRWLSAYGMSPGGGGAGSGGAAAMYQLIDVSPNDTKDAVLGAEKDYVLTFDGNFWRGMPNKGGLSSKLFTALDKDGNEVNPDDENSEIYAIRANYSLWSVGFLSAKGISDGGAGGGGGGAVALYQLLDVEKNSDITGVAGATKGSVLTFDGDKWYADKPKTAEGINRLFSALDADGNEVDLNDESKLGTITNIRANYALWSVDWISAKGKSSGGSGGGGGLISLVYGFESLGGTFDNNDNTATFNAFTINEIWKLASSGLTNVTVTGSGNAVTDVTKGSDGRSLTFTKGNMFASKSEFDALNTKFNDFLTGSDADDIINKWSELEVFLQGMKESDNLAVILQSKMDKSAFNKLFSALDSDGNEIDPSDDTKTVAAIRANFGFWGVDYVSAKGVSKGSGGTGGASALYQLVDVLANDTGDGVDGAVAGKALVFDGTHWKAADAGLNESQLSAFLSLNGYLTQTAADGRYVTSARKVIAGTGLSGGGSLTSDVTLSLGTSGVVAGTYTKVMVDVYGRVTSGTSLSATDIPSLDWSKITTGKPTTLAGYGITDAYSKTEADGKYVTIATAQTISGAKTFSAVTKTASVLPSADANSELGGTANRWNNIYSVNGTFSQNVTAKLLSASETLQIGDAYLKWDSTNNAVYVIKKDGTTPVGFYSTDWLSAKGVSMSGVQTGTLADLTDVEITNPTNGQALKYDAISQKWVNGTIDSFNVNQMWTELTKADSSKVIDASHIPTSVLDGRWVKKAGDTMTGALHLANGTRNNAGDDCGFGDCNIAGCLGLQGLNGATGLAFIQQGASWSGGNNYKFTWNGSNMVSSSTALWNNLNADMLDNWHLNFLPRNYNIGRCYAVKFALGGEDNGWKKIFACSESGAGPYRSVTVWGRIWYAYGNHAQSEVRYYHFCAIFYMRSVPSSSNSSVGNVENSARLYLPTFAKGMDNIRLVRVGTNNFELQVRQIGPYHNANIEYQYWSYGCNVSAWENLQSTSNTSVAVSAGGASTLADSRASSADVWTSARTFYIQDHNASHTGAGVSVNGSANVYLKLPNSIQCGDLKIGNGTNSPRAKLDVAGNVYSTGFFYSTVGTGTAPYQCSSTTLNANLNADLLDGYHQTAFSMGWTSSTKYRLDRWGGGQDKNWKKIVTYVNTGGGQYQSCKVKGTIYYITGNYNQGHVIDIPFEAIMYAYGGTANSMLNQSYLYLPPYCTWDMIRIVRYNNNSWEVQVRQPSDWTNISLEYTVTNNGGSVSAGQFANTSYSSTVANNYNTNVSRPTSSRVLYADRLTTARTLWGRSFDGTANIDGNLDNVGVITSKGGIWLDLKGSSGVAFYSGGSLSAVINSTGMGIGNSSPSQKLHVTGNIIATGAITAKASSSDIRLKTDIQDYDAMGIIRKFRSVKYHWNNLAKRNSEIFNHKKWNYGLIAQDLLSGGYSQWVSDIFKDYYTIDYERLIPVVWKGLQEVDDEVTKLRKEVVRLNKRISELEKFLCA